MCNSSKCWTGGSYGKLHIDVVLCHAAAVNHRVMTTVHYSIVVPTSLVLFECMIGVCAVVADR